MIDSGRPAQPIELLRSAPRPVRLTVAGLASVVVAAALVAGACLGGAWLYTSATRDAARLRLLRAEGVSVQGTVIGLGRTRGDHPRRVVSYEYAAAGHLRRGRATLRSRERFAIGSTIPVRFLPSEPSTSWLPGHEPRGVPLWVVPVVPACLVLGALPIAYAVRKQHRLLADGRVAQAQVTSTRRVNNGQGQVAYRVGYEFRVLSGAACSGSYDKAKDPPPIGSVLTVLYEPDEPARNARYPLPLVRVAPL